VCLNLTQPKAVGIAKQLAAKSDVVVENMRPGVISRLGLGYEALREVKPDIIFLSSSSCGQTGPDRGHVGYAPNFASAAGLSYVTGYPDWTPSVLSGAIDLRSATTAAFSVLAALICHQRTGEGQHIDLASQETSMMLNSHALMDYLINGRVQTRRGNQDIHDRMAPHNCYRCRGEDEWISIAVATDDEWKALCTAMDKPELAEDERFSEVERRWSRQEEIDGIVGEWTADRDAHELTRRLQEAGVAAAPSLSNKALFEDPHLKERGVFVQVDHPHLGKDWVLSPPFQLSETPASIRRHAPSLGEHNQQVFGDLLGMSAGEIEKLAEERVIY
jgi:benzylsuccinate CoA-transferase BbsF subunit